MAASKTLAPEDRPRWNELWRGYQRFYGIVIAPEVSDATWSRIQTQRIMGCGARDASGRLVGFAHCLFHEDTWSASPACYLQDLYVDPAQRGAGHGRRLIETAAAAARAAGASAPYWLTHESNAAARALYDKLGWNQGFIQYAYDAHSAHDDPHV